jgi:hypothetical protein
LSGEADKQHERDELVRLLASEGWDLVVGRIRQMRERKFRELLDNITPQETDRVRGFIQGLECCLRVPAILLDERPPTSTAK